MARDYGLDIKDLKTKLSIGAIKLVTSIASYGCAWLPDGPVTAPGGFGEKVKIPALCETAASLVSATEAAAQEFAALKFKRTYRRHVSADCVWQHCNPSGISSSGSRASGRKHQLFTIKSWPRDSHRNKGAVSHNRGFGFGC